MSDGTLRDSAVTLAARVAQQDWAAAAQALNEHGHAVLPSLLSRSECESLRAGYDDDARFRSTVVMARHNFGRGEYRYFKRPLPDPVAGLRAAFYSPLRAIADDWADALGEPAFPGSHDGLLQACAAAGQHRPTCLLLRYRSGDYNCLHQDLYGPVVFPLQAIVLLSAPAREFDGGQLVLSEQRPRMQSRAHVVTPEQGDAVVIATHHLPRRGARGWYRATLRHGVATITAGERFTLGIILHDAT